MGTLDHINVVSKEELQQIYGGLKLSGTLISSFVKAYNALMDIGRSFGTAIRRIRSRKLCGLF